MDGWLTSEARPVWVRDCQHCDSRYAATQCRLCGRSFVLTAGHLVRRMRAFEDPAIPEWPAATPLPVCDQDIAKNLGLTLREQVEAGLRQKTCPTCHRQTVVNPR